MALIIGVPVCGQCEQLHTTTQSFAKSRVPQVKLKGSFLRPELLIGKRGDCWHLNHDLRVVSALVACVARSGEVSVGLGICGFVHGLDRRVERLHRRLDGRCDHLGDWQVVMFRDEFGNVI